MKPIFDVHIHTLGAPGSEEKIETMLHAIHRQGVDKGVLLACTYRDSTENMSGLYFKSRYDKMKLWAFGGLHHSDCFADIPYEEQVKAMLDLGCDGVKLMDTFPFVRRCLEHGVDHKSYDKMFAYLEENRVPILAHVSNPIHCWGEGQRHSDGTYLSKEAHYQEMFRVLEKFPKLNITFAHFFFMSDDLPRAIEVMEAYPHVYFDLTPGVEMYRDFAKNPEAWHDFFEKYSHRLMFGADVCPHTTHCTEELYALILDTLTHDHTPFERSCYGMNFHLRGLALSEEAVDQICRKTATEFIKNEPKKVDKEKLRQALKTMISALEQNPYPQKPLRYEMPAEGLEVRTPAESIAVLECYLSKIE